MQPQFCGSHRLPGKTGGSKGASLWHTALLAKCSVLYLLSRLAGKMRVSPDGNTRFARQENGQVLADEMSKMLGGFGSDSRDMNHYVNNLLTS